MPEFLYINANIPAKKIKKLEIRDDALVHLKPGANIRTKSG